VAGYTGGFVHDLSRPAGMRRKLLDVSRLDALGWRAGIGLAEGLGETLEAYRALGRRQVAA
jgi:GDP-L-fucose synthase